MGRLSENSVVNIKNKSFSVTANIEVPDGGAEGDDHRPGWALRWLDPVFPRSGTAKFVYNVLGINEFAIAATEPIASGAHQVRVEFAYDGGGLGKGGDVTLYYDGNAGRHGQGRVHPGDDLLGRRDHGRGLRERDDRQLGATPRKPAGSPARSSGFRSTLATTQRSPHRSRGATQDRHGPAVAPGRVAGHRFAMASRLRSRL